MLIANRGEIAVRVAAAAAGLGIETVVVYAQDDARSLHRRRGDADVALPGSGPAAYLDQSSLLRIAREQRCDAVHPGYGFLAERADFARACAQAGLRFAGPQPETLELFADKVLARGFAARCGVPVLPGSSVAVTPADARAFLRSLESGGAVMIKAVAGGGGRGMRVVTDEAGIDAAFAACEREAEQAFGDGRLLIEKFIARARHVEVQVIGDGTGAVLHLGERDCSLQRRHQKLVEIAPCPGLPDVLRVAMTSAAIDMATAARYGSLGTFEFLIDADELARRPSGAGFVFIEANPRVQVEHTVTEEVMGIDLVATQLEIAAGASLESLGLEQRRFATTQGSAMQLRINLEAVGADGTTRAASGTLDIFEMPAGHGVRVDGYGYAGYEVNPRYDSLLAKLVVRRPDEDLGRLVAKALRHLRECRVSGAATNIGFLEALLQRPEVASIAFHTRFVDEHVAALAGVLTTPRADIDAGPAATDGGWLRAPMQGTVTEIHVSPGDAVVVGQTLLLIEAMKMVHPVAAPCNAEVRELRVRAGETVSIEQILLRLDLREGDPSAEPSTVATSAGESLALVELLERRRLCSDEARPDAVARRRATGPRTARENIADLCGDGSFIEYGALAIAAQQRRRKRDDLIRNTPADGIVTGIGEVNADRFDAAAARCVVLAYDYTVLAGTQGHQTHRKQDRLLRLAARQRLPVVLFAEGGGGRPGDIDVLVVTGLEIPTFRYMADLSGLVPLVGIASGRCFAGNAALLGCCDVVIATRDSSIGMGGPVLVESAGLGRYRPEDIGPAPMQAANGVIDILVEDEAEAVAVARRYLSYFQGDLPPGPAPDMARLRGLLPLDRRRPYDVREVIEAIADGGSVLELRSGFGRGIVTALLRIEGRPLGVIANNPMALGGAIDGDAADKAARFMQLCDAHALPILSLCDTPGFLVGPAAEATATVRRFARLFVTAAGMTTTMMAIVLRKAYGLGAMAMFGGHARVPELLVSWPAGEFGGMGLEGAVRLGLRKELEAIADPQAREAHYQEQLAAAYRFGRAENAASMFEIDDVIDPAESRRWIASHLPRRSASQRPRGKRRNHIDTW